MWSIRCIRVTPLRTSVPLRCRCSRWRPSVVVTRTVRKNSAPENGPSKSSIFLLSTEFSSRLVVVVPVRSIMFVLAPLMVVVYSLRLNLLGSGVPIMTSLKLDLNTSCWVLVLSGMTRGWGHFSLVSCVETHLPESVLVSMTRVCFTWNCLPLPFLSPLAVHCLDGAEAADVSASCWAGGTS